MITSVSQTQTASIFLCDIIPAMRWADSWSFDYHMNQECSGNDFVCMASKDCWYALFALWLDLPQQSFYIWYKIILIYLYKFDYVLIVEHLHYQLLILNQKCLPVFIENLKYALLF